MGQKVNAIGLRVGINKQTDSRWFADKDFADKLHEDLKIQQYVKKNLAAAGVSKVVIAWRARSEVVSPSSTPSPCRRS